MPGFQDLNSGLFYKILHQMRPVDAQRLVAAEPRSRYRPNTQAYVNRHFRIASRRIREVASTKAAARIVRAFRDYIGMALADPRSYLNPAVVISDDLEIEMLSHLPKWGKPMSTRIDINVFQYTRDVNAPNNGRYGHVLEFRVYMTPGNGKTVLLRKKYPFFKDSRRNNFGAHAMKLPRYIYIQSIINEGIKLYNAHPLRYERWPFRGNR
jgi:hypothetical protein